VKAGGGKSELHRARCRVTRFDRSGIHAGGLGENLDQQRVPQKTNRQSSRNGTLVRVKRRGKSPPPEAQATGHGKPHREQDQIGNLDAARVILRKQGVPGIGR